MHDPAGQGILAVLVIGVTGMVLYATVARASDAWRGTAAPREHGIRDTWHLPGRGYHPRARAPRGSLGFLGYRRALKLETHKHRLAMIREAARHHFRMKEREAARTPPEGQSSGAPAGGTQRPRVIRLRPERAGPGSRPASPPGPAPGPESPESPPQAPPSHPPSSSSSQPSQQPGGTAMASGAVEQAIEALGHIHMEAMSGGITGKRRAVLALAELQQRVNQTAFAISRAMSEPGQNYGPEITEKIAAAGTHAQASALVFAQADAALSALLQATLAESMQVNRKIPHPQELTETGKR